MAITDIDGYITDKVNQHSWMQTFYSPLDTTLDDVVLPDLVTTIPTTSVSSGFASQRTTEHPTQMIDDKLKISAIPKNQTAVHSGYDKRYNISMTDQSPGIS